MENFLGYLQVALPGLESEKYTQVLSYLRDKGVSSFADVHKITEEELADILGGEAARTLIECIRATVGTGPPNNEAASAAGPWPTSQQQCTVGTVTQPVPFGNSVSTLAVSRGPVHGNSGAVACTPAAGTQSVANADNGATMKDLLQMVLAVQQTEAGRTRELMLYEGNKTKELVSAMVCMQDRNLQAMQNQMTQTAGCFSAALDTMNKQMSQQAEWNRDTVNLMSEQMTNSNRIHADTLKQMQSAMEGQDKRHAETLSMMNSTIARTGEQHEETVRRLQELKAKNEDPACVIS